MKIFFIVLSLTTLVCALSAQTGPSAKPWLQEENPPATLPISAPAAHDRSPGPDWNWMRHIGGSGSDNAAGIAQDAAGNLYVAGVFSGATTFGAQTLSSTGRTDAYLAKYDAAGNLIWVRQVEAASADHVASGVAVAADPGGNVWLAGQSTGGAITIDAQNYPTLHDPGGFVVKFSAAGALQWVNAGSSAGSKKIARNDSGASFVVSDDWVRALDANGSEIWSRPDDISDDATFGTVKWYDNKLFLSGSFADEADLDGTVLQTANAGLFLAELDPITGAYLSAELLGSTTYAFKSKRQNIVDFAFDADGNLYLAGFSQKETTIGTCPSNIYWGVPNTFIAKLDANSACQWLITPQLIYLNNYPNALLLDTDGSLFVYGFKNGALKFDGFTIPDQGQPGYIVKLNAADGSAIWGAAQPLMSGGILTASNTLAQVGTTGYHALLLYSDNLGVATLSVTTLGDNGNGLIAGVETDGSGIYLSGEIGGYSQFFDGTTASNRDNLFIGKTDLEGENLLWSWVFPNANANYFSQGEPFILDKTTDRLYCTGSYTGIFDMPGLPALNSFGARHTLLLCVDVSGNLLWASDLGEAQINNVAADGLGNFIVSGVFTEQLILSNIVLNATEGDAAFIAKLNASGQALWAKQMEGANIEYSLTASADGDGSIYFTGEFLSEVVNFDGAFAINLPLDAGNIVLGKLNPAGDLLWIKSYGETGQPGEESNNFPSNFKTDAAGNSYMAGFMGYSVVIGDLHLTSPYEFNNFVVKFDPLGEPIWAKVIEMKTYGLNYSELGIDDAGNCYIMGQLRDSVLFDDQLAVASGISTDGYVAKCANADGAFEWVKTLGSFNVTTSNMIPTGMSVLGEDNLLVGGRFANELSFDGEVLDVKSGRSGYLGLLGADIGVATEEIDPGHSLVRLYPNPSPGPVHFEAASAPLNASMHVEVLDAKGASLLSRLLDRAEFERGIDLAVLPSGVYFVKITLEKRVEIKKVVIE